MLNQTARKHALGAMWLLAALGCRTATRDPNENPNACTTPAAEVFDDPPAAAFQPQPDGSLNFGDGAPPPLPTTDGARPDFDGGPPMEPPPGADSGMPLPNANVIPANYRIQTETGYATTYSPTVPFGAELPIADAFTKPLGRNSRSCRTCHEIDAWTTRLKDVDGYFAGRGLTGPVVSNDAAASNDDLQPIFRLVDGATSPKADVSTPDARKKAYALLLARDVIRVGLPIPKGAEFTLAAVDDPYGYASAAELSLFRRMLPTANLRFLADVMWDGRETASCYTIGSDLANQANDATVSHEAGDTLDDAIRESIVAFERNLYFAAIVDNEAGPLDGDGGLGGPVNLAKEPFYPGINRYEKTDPRGNAYTAEVFTLYAAWASLTSTAPYAQARAAVARGEALFNTKRFAIRGVRGLNDDLAQEEIQGTCTTCHTTPNVGGNSEGRQFDLGIADASRRSPDVPLYTLRNGATRETIQTTDPGRALVSGRWKDIGRFKVPSLRGLVSRPPYFHDGSAATLADVVDEKVARFAIDLTPSERDDLLAFLRAL
jgi:hypothetical protein